MSSSLTFLGAARTVTGSRYLVEAAGTRVLVDCGMFQGLKELRLRNWADAAGAAGVDRIGRAHARPSRPRRHAAPAGRPGVQRAHLLHPGDAGPVLPRAARMPGASRKKRPSAPTATATRSTSPPSPSSPKRTPSRPCRGSSPWGMNDPFRWPMVPSRWSSYPPVISWAPPTCGCGARDGEGGTVLFGGDLGRYNRPVLADPSRRREDRRAARRVHLRRPAAPGGGRNRAPEDPHPRDGRTQGASSSSRRLRSAGWRRCSTPSSSSKTRDQVPTLPVYVDSPMALKALEFYKRHAHELDDDIQKRRGEVCAFCTARFTAGALRPGVAGCRRAAGAGHRDRL